MMSNKKHTIVLIEDHPDIIQMYTVVFETMLGIKPFVAEDMETGIALVKDIKPDLVLLDLVIPVKKGDSFEATSKHGFDLAETLKAEEDFKDLPIVMLTNLESMEDREHAKNIGALDYIIKSQTLPNQVAKLVKSFLNSR